MSAKTDVRIRVRKDVRSPVSSKTAETDRITTAETGRTDRSARTDRNVRMATDRTARTDRAEKSRDATAGIRVASARTETLRTRNAASRTDRDSRVKTTGTTITETVITDLRIRSLKAEPVHQMAQVSLKGSERIDDLQRAGLKIIQDPGRFCFGMDAVLLSYFAKAADGARVLDLGTGTGILPILMSAKTGAAHLTGLEIQAESAEMAARSVLMNDLTDRVSIVEGDIKEAGRLFPRASFDVITCNPPYLQGDHGILNPGDAKAIARHEMLCTLEDVIRESEILLKPGGHFYMVHRPFRLSEIMCTMHDHHLEPKRMRLVYPMIDREPNMVLIEGVRGANVRITVEKPLILQNADGSYTEEVRELYGF